MSRPFTLVAMVALYFAVLFISGASATSDENEYVPVRIGSDNASSTVVVQKGDHLWKISRVSLEKATGEGPSNQQIDPYWRETIRINRETLRSGDPDLIFPGEVVALPDPISG